RAPVNRAIPPESARNGKNPKLQTPLFGNMPPSALSGIVVQTFLNGRSRLIFESLIAKRQRLFAERTPDPLRGRVRCATS
ncbi:hypothetical protein, partial [Xanthomonas vasicola]|uniref:hypothetical protein n=2 Tax=Xanthomonas vasicola TaxID=56459 RepID=UPI001A92C4F1